ncbi:MAG TPA: ABC transporter permease, partial [Propionibacteriaceae bacterium]|nr:ABC transporter permease [Propionibacteriaceae bacterium]
MFADAAREVRFHPGRVIATLIAIAISVAFMVASSTFITTQQHSLGKQLALQASNADLVVTGEDSEKFGEITAALQGVPGVAQAEETRVTNGPLRSDDATVMAVLYVVPGETFRWSSIRDGEWPTEATQIALSKEAAKKLNVSVGDTVTSGGKDLTVVGLTNDPRSIFQQTGYIAPALADETGMVAGTSGQWLVRAADGTDVEALAATVAQATAPLQTVVKTADEFSGQQLDDLTEQTNVMKLMLAGFAGVAL